nr:hypothetical protein Iba_chr01bCG2490 [Ipomoea batatas]
MTKVTSSPLRRKVPDQLGYSHYHTESEEISNLETNWLWFSLEAQQQSERARMFNAKVAQKLMLAVREGKKRDQNCEDVSLEDKESMWPNPPAFTYDQMRRQECPEQGGDVGPTDSEGGPCQHRKGNAVARAGVAAGERPLPGRRRPEVIVGESGIWVNDEIKLRGELGRCNGLEMAFGFGENCRDRVMVGLMKMKIEAETFGDHAFEKRFRFGKILYGISGQLEIEDEWSPVAIIFFFNE